MNQHDDEFDLDADPQPEGPGDPRSETGSFDLTPEGDDPVFDEGLIDGDASEDGGPHVPDEQSTESMSILDEMAAGTGGEADAAGPGLSGGDLDSEALAELRAERDEFESKFLRVTADYQNYIRRAARELDVARTQRTVELGRSMINALDNFDRALEVDPEQTSADEILRGIASIRDELVRSLEGFGFSKLVVEPGAEFDPNVHEALMHQPHNDIASGHVIQTFMPGYFVGETPVRPAQVSVAQ